MSLDSTVRWVLKHGKITKVKNDFMFYPDQKYYKKFGFNTHIVGIKSESLKGIVETVATLLRS